VLAPHVAPPRPTAATLVLALALALGPWSAALLFVLSRFGQSPPDALPWAVIALLGALLGAPAAAAAAHLPRPLAASIAAAGGGLSLAVTVVAGLPLAYTATVPVTLLVVALLRALPGERPELYGAALVYVGCTILANFTFDSFLPLGDFFLVNVGTFFFGVTFTQRDRLHRFGRSVVYRVIVAAAVANVVAALAVGTPLRYVAVSFLAILISETADTEVYHRLLHRRWLTRVAGSNAVSAPLDTIVFTTLAFAGAPFATAAWMTQVIVTDVLVKYAASLVAAITVLSRPAWVPRPPGG
jgi:uncharacterized PurR-regulated membrane protein YhhQ (DUF165 family)